ncbi:hypothetical protein M5689_020855 [Euphorbia peplus]|nr:hypothetical protein M5689_020855 [Euphorbia peplus]
MADNGRVHPDCRNASNPYHECGVSCLEKIAQGQGKKTMDKKKSDYHNGINGGLSKKMDGERRTDQNCPKATNPYHQCDKFCSSRTSKANPQEVKKKSGSFLENSLSFGRKKKGSDSQPNSPQAVTNSYAGRKKKGSESQANSAQVTTNVPAPKAPYPVETFSPPALVPAIKKVESENSQSSSSSHNHSDGSFSQDHSFEKGQTKSSEIVPASGNLKPNGSKSLPLGSFTCFAIGPPETKPEAVVSPTAMNGPTVGSLNFTFSGISRATQDSDDDEIQSVISDSCVSIGKYHVRASAASVLQLILDKYGDIAANCKLESTSLRAYYLECLCSLVQELQSTSYNLLTRSKVKEFLAVLKDVESAQIDVSWLRDILNGLTEAVEINNQQAVAEEAQANCNDLIESTKKELESMMEDLAEKEKAVAEAKARIEETKARLSGLEVESSQLNETISSLCAKLEKFQAKPLAQQIL